MIISSVQIVPSLSSERQEVFVLFCFKEWEKIKKKKKGIGENKYVCIVLGMIQQRNKNWYYNRKGEEFLKFMSWSRWEVGAST